MTSRKSKPTNRLRTATAAESKAMEKVFADIRRQEAEAENARRDAPRINFIADAVAAGFTKKQATFLWEQIPDTRWMDIYRPIAGARSSDV